MIIIETCPKCGQDLVTSVICANPPFPRKVCLECGWSWEGQREQIIRVPFNENESPYATLDCFENDPCIKCVVNPRNGGNGFAKCRTGP